MMKIPAKILLFGEYGMLRGGRGISVTLFKEYFDCELGFGTPEQEQNDFLNKVFEPYRDQFDEFPYLKIHRHFPSSYGFGSSSALIVAAHQLARKYLGLKVIEKNSIPKDAWDKIQHTLQATQGGGSGYDVACQWMAAATISEEYPMQTWSFQRGEGVPTVAPVTLNFELRGCFLHSGVFASTKDALKEIPARPDFELFASYHKQLAQEFETAKSWTEVLELMRESHIMAWEMGLYGHEKNSLHALVKLFLDRKIPFKMCGAGLGDSFWIGISRAELSAYQLTHPVTLKPLVESVIA